MEVFARLRASILAVISFTWLCVTSVETQAAQQYPVKPVRVIVPFAPGGGSDIVLRQIGPKLQQYFGQSFVVDNRGGGGGSIGAEMAARAVPDGYTLIVGSGSYAANAAVYKPSYDPVSGITPIAEIGFSPFIVSIHPSVPARTLPELIAYARQQPGKLSYGSSGKGGVTHLATELLTGMSGLKLVHVPYKASSLALTDLLGGQIQLVVGSMLPTLPHMKAGRLVGLAVTTAERWPTTPNLPTVAETLPGYDVELWFGMWGPKSLPAPVVAQLNAGVNKALREPDVEQQLAAGGLRTSGGAPQRFAERIRKDVARWQKLVATGAIESD